jgi:alginate O-acetyltransferase complex protein AlgI
LGTCEKVVVADNCALVVNQIFLNSEVETPGNLLVGAIFFSFQIHCDFSGYLDIAIGTSRLFGFDLMQNFRYPYFSRDMAEFWRRWHISLSTWFRDYLYIPLGGSKGGKGLQIRNTLIIFIVSGFWHGANWTFIVWGLLNALFFIPLLLSGSNRKNTGEIVLTNPLQSLKVISQIELTFTLTTFIWIFFRSNSITQAYLIIKKILYRPFDRLTVIFEYQSMVCILAIILLLIVKWKSKNTQHGLQYFLTGRRRIWGLGFYIILIWIIILFSGPSQDFIYFQF